MSIWGKFSGAVAGLVTGGPLGALLGALAGHFLVDRDGGDDAIGFTIAVIALSAS